MHSRIRWTVLLFVAVASFSYSYGQDNPACGKFEQWKQGIKKDVGAAEAAKGMDLAKERRAELKQLIARNPKLALKNAIPKGDRGLFAGDVSGLLEQDVSGQGFVGPLMADKFDDTNAVPSVSMTINGQMFRVFLHGKQFSRKQWWNVPVRGIAIDGLAALADDAEEDIPAPKRVVKTKGVNRTYETGQVKVIGQGGFDKIELAGLTRFGGDEPGTPWLPAEVINVAIPPGAEVRDIKVKFNEEKILDGIVPPPVQRQVPKNPDADRRPTPPKAEAYNLNEIVPKEVAKIVGDHNLRGHRYVSLRLNPLRYHAASKTLYAISDLSVDLVYEPAVIMPAAWPGAPMDEAAESVRRLVLNPEEVEGPMTPGALDVSAPVVDQPAIEPPAATGGSASSNVQPMGGTDTLGFSAYSYSVQENGGSVVISVTRANSKAVMATVHFSTANGTALAGTDYTATNGTLAWASGEKSTKTFLVPIIDNAIVDGDRTFEVYLSNLSGSTPSITNATVTIKDDEIPGTLAFAASSNTTSESSGCVTVLVARTSGSFGTVSVEYYTREETAMGGVDFVATNGTVTWTNGDTASKPIAITVLNDTVFQGNHSFSVLLRNPVAATLGSPDINVVTIVDNEPVPPPVDYLIITTDEMAPTFAELAAHRRAFNGFAVEIRTVSDIVAQYGGVDPAAKIRSCIVQYVTTRNLAYVVLGGDDLNVPVRYCPIPNDSATPTDLYYSGLDSNWDTNGDGIYGDYGEADIAYDVIVGRIPVREADQARAYIRKLVNYDTNPPYSLAGKFMLSGHILWDSYTGTDRPVDAVNDGNVAFRAANHTTVSDAEMWVRRNYRDHVLTGWSASTVGCMFDTLTSWDTSVCGDYLCSPANLVQKYNLGWNFLLNDTHGNWNILQHEAGMFGTSEAYAITNLTTIFYTGGCRTGGFDAAEPSLSEAMLRNPNGGSLIYIGCSRDNWGMNDTPPADSTSTGGTGQEYAGDFWRCIFNAKMLIAGKAFAAHKLYAGPNGNSMNLQYGLNLQGDPAIQIIGVKPFVFATAPDVLAAEPGADKGQFLIHRQPATGSLSVSLNWSGTATLSGGSSDIMETLPTSVTFTNGESDKIITITPKADALVETNETVSLTVATNASYEIGSRIATVMIVDSSASGLPTVSITTTEDFAAEQGSKPGIFTFTRLGNASNAVTIVYAVSGTASATDYSETLTGSITIPAGQTTTNITITPVDDSLPEGSETVIVTIQSGAYTISAGSATVVIVDNEPPPAVTVTATDPSAREDTGDKGNFRISRPGDTTLPLTVNLAAGGTCIPGVDYVALTSSVTFASGVANINIPVEALDDLLVEPPETVVLWVVSGAGYYSVGSPGADTVTIISRPPPVCTVIPPANGGVVKAGTNTPIAATATAMALGATVSQVEFYCDGVKIGADSIEPYTCVWTNVPVGSHTLTTKATDSAGMHGESAAVYVTVTASGMREGNRMRIDLSGYTRSETLANFPALVKLGTNRIGFAYSQFVSPNGWDLRFIADDDVTEIPYEIESWDTNGISCVWVRVPTLTSNSWVTAWWGDASQTPQPLAYTTNGAVWLNGYAGVWHMGSEVRDSTVNRNDAATVTATEAAGLAGSSRYFNYSCIQIPDNDSLDPARLTVSVWYKHDGNSGVAWDRLVDKGYINGYTLNFNNTSLTPGLSFNNNPFYSSGGDTSQGVWHYEAGVYDGSATRLYVDAVERGAQSKTTDMSNSPYDLTIGMNGSTSPNGECFLGWIDEVRISSVGRSADWVWAEYQNMAANDAFCAYRAVEQISTNTIRVVTDVSMVNVPEGGTATLQVKLSALPTGSVVVAVSRMTGDSDISVSGGASRTFTTGNWNTYQAVTLAAAVDADAIDGSASIVCSATGCIGANVMATEIDTDTILTVTAGTGGAVSPSGSTMVIKGVATPISAVADSGYAFTSWAVTSGSATFADSNAPSTTVTISAPATVRANFIADWLTCTITSPANCTVVKAGTNVTIEATASSSGGTVSKVEFLVDGVVMGEDTSAPYIFTWSGISIGTYSLTARVTDSLGGICDSAATFVSATASGLPEGYRMRIDLTGYTRSEALIDFPCLVVLGTNRAGFAYGQFLSASGWDLRFTAADGVTELPYEIERWNSSGPSYVWVRVPALTSSTWMTASWGDASKLSQRAYTTNGAVWNAGFKGVWHLGESSGMQFDATANRNDGTPNGEVTLGAPGMVGLCDSFAGGAGSTGVQVGSALGSAVGAANMTMGCWAYLSSASQHGSFLQVASGGAGHEGYGVGVGNTHFEDSGNNLISLYEMVSWNPTPTSIGTGWHHVVFKLDGAGALTLYLDGTSVYTKGTGPHDGIGGSFFMGGYGGARNPNCKLDEVRVSATARSSDWIWAEYMNVAANDAFAAYGAIKSGAATNAVALVTDVSSVNVPEGGTATFQVKLSVQPTGDVTVAVARTTGDTDIGVSGGASLTFTTGNWDSYQTVTLAAAEDGDAANGTATIACTAAGVSAASVQATETDNDTTLTINAGTGGTVSPDGATVVTKSQAATIGATPSAGFTFANWTVTSGSAAIANSNSANTTVTISTPATVQASFAQNTVALLTDVLAVQVPEGGTGTFQVKLSAQPTGNVTVAVSRTAGDGDIGVNGGASLTFTTGNWDSYQTVTLAAAEDADTAAGMASISCAAGGLGGVNVTATEGDNDTTLTINAGTGGTVSPDGATVVTKGVATAIGATVNGGYVFVCWTVIGGSATIADTNAADTTVTISAPATIQANFAIYDPDGDTDGDGMNNRDEITAGTDPTNRLSVLCVSASEFRAPSSEFVIRWQSASNKLYTLQAATNLINGFNLILGTNIPATPPENVHTDGVSGAGCKFYRIRVE